MTGTQSGRHAVLRSQRHTHGEPAPVDYLLVNIESAWHEMLRHGQWTKNVRCIQIEIQDHYDEAVPMLETLGYQARLQLLSWGAFATGIRPADPATGQG